MIEDKGQQPAEAPDSQPPSGDAAPRQEGLPKPGKIAQGLLDLQAQAVKDKAGQPEGHKGRGRRKGSKNKPKSPKGDAADDAAKLAALKEAGKGIFYGLSVGLGEHWKLNDEQAQILAQSWQPLMDYYDVEPGAILLWVTATSVSVAIIGPRVQVSVQKRTGLIGKLTNWWRNRKARRTVKAEDA